MSVRVLGFIFFLATAASISAQFDDPFGGGQADGSQAATKVKLLVSHDTIKPGSTVTAGLELTMADGWHTYWINPGEAGIVTSVEWKLPKGVTAGQI